MRQYPPAPVNELIIHDANKIIHPWNLLFENVPVCLKKMLMLTGSILRKQFLYLISANHLKNKYLNLTTTCKPQSEILHKVFLRFTHYEVFDQTDPRPQTLEAFVMPFFEVHLLRKFLSSTFLWVNWFQKRWGVINKVKESWKKTWCYEKIIISHEKKTKSQRVTKKYRELSQKSQKVIEKVK